MCTTFYFHKPHEKVLKIYILSILSTLSVIHDNVKNFGVALESDPNQNDSIVDDERSNIFCIINELVQNAAENIETRPINHYVQTPEEQGNIQFE